MRTRPDNYVGKCTDTDLKSLFFIVSPLLCKPMNYAYLLTGGNIGKREYHLTVAAQQLEQRGGNIIERSSLYETAPWGKADQAMFLNQVLVIETHMNARELLNTILLIENLMGRDRSEKYGPRIIDIDIIFFNHLILNEPGLILPHPHLASRRFVLAPLNEVAAAYIHPVYYKTVTELLNECTDPLEVKKL
jgi:2-amino-4-hydroxy-6-hydroxymethyldihydropteridine diphosphokinase